MALDSDGYTLVWEVTTRFPADYSRPEKGKGSHLNYLIFTINI